MAFDYSNLASTSLRMVERFGRTLTIRTTTSSGTSYNPTISNVDTSVIGVVTDFSDGQIDGSLIKQGDKKILVKTSIDINTKTKIIDESVTYEVINVRKIKPGGTSLLQIVQARST